MERRAGSGRVRIGENMEIMNDLYSMLFVSSLHAEYILYLDQDAEMKNKAIENMFQDFRKEDISETEIAGKKWEEIKDEVKTMDLTEL